jgi:DNA polymerase-3 subunit delta
MAASYEQIIKDAKQGKFSPVYYLCGEETYFLDIIEETLLKTALSPGQEDFNLHIFYAKDTPMNEIIAACKQYPTFAERQVVLVREAQQINKQDDWKFFESYLDHPIASTVLIIVHKHKTPDKRTALGKKLDAKTVYFDAVKLKEAELPAKIKQFITAKGLNINDDGALQLAENLGNDLSRIVNEIDKLGLTLEKGTQVTPEIIEKYIGISREYNQFEFSNAIQDRDEAKAFKIIHYFSLNPKAGPFPVLITFVFGFFSKLWVVHHMKSMSDSDIAKEAGINPYIVKKLRTAMTYYPLHKTEQILADIAEYDARSKGIGGGSQEPYELLKELTYKMMHHYEKV